MEPVVLEASIRADLGTAVGRRLRRQGAIPAIVYGKGHSPCSLVMPEQALARVLRTAAGENVLITLRLTQPDGQVHADRTVLIKEIQQHPVTSQVLHVDFHQISLTQRIEVTVPLEFSGDAVGVKQGGGRLDHLLWDVRVECLPTDIPKAVIVEVSSLAVGDSRWVKDLVVPPGVTILHDPQVAVVACVPQAVEKAPELAAAGPVEPEVIKQKKPDAEEPADAGSEEGATGKTGG